MFTSLCNALSSVVDSLSASSSDVDYYNNTQDFNTSYQDTTWSDAGWIDSVSNASMDYLPQNIYYDSNPFDSGSGF